ncbi:glutaredoxin-related protein [Thermococcus sp. 4557]|uniref:glutaredoxin family protein n=1 Tax=Thermococcus sp. (strain CGMCC 1.5172 / 4557) TaxID=1042877 RepID=UPI000219EED0|nr:thioredoxin fold domain-containing protein [Thermococcus sp. 4557]AEK72468.1 glutaredoxin-related protein [Thermococcus sp. 4557]
MKKFGIVLLIILLAGFAAGCISNSGGSNTSSTTQTTSSGGSDYVVVNGTKIYLDDIHFYMYGMKTCPHCHKMREEISETYGEDSLTYYELVDNEENSKLFQRIYQITGIQGVPAIAITYNGTLYAVLEGEFNVTAVPKIIYTGMKNNGAILAVGGKVYLLPRDKEDSAKVIDELYTLFVEHKMPPQESNSTSD